VVEVAGRVLEHVRQPAEHLEAHQPEQLAPRGQPGEQRTVARAGVGGRAGCLRDDPVEIRVQGRRDRCAPVVPATTAALGITPTPIEESLAETVRGAAPLPR
jgi:hypothetical protein